MGTWWDDLVDAKTGKFIGKAGYSIDIPFFHFQDCWPNQHKRKQERHLYWLGTEQVDRKMVYGRIKNRKWTKPKKVLDIIPTLFKPLAYMENYYVREELFDLDYLKSIYGDLL